MSRGSIARPIDFTAISSATATQTGYPAEKAGTVQPRQHAVFTDSPAVIDIDLAYAQDVRLAALIATNATHWRLAAADAQAELDGAAAIVSEALTGAGAGIERIFFDETAHTHRWWRVTLTGPTALYIGRIILSDPFIPRHTFSYGRVYGRQPGLKFDVAAGGSLHPHGDAQRRRWAVTFEDLRDGEYRASLDALDAYTSGGGAILFCADPTAAVPEAESLYALMSLTEGAMHRSINRWRAPIVLEELT